MKPHKYLNSNSDTIREEIEDVGNEFLEQDTKDIIEQIEQNQRKIDVSWYETKKKKDESWEL